MQVYKGGDREEDLLSADLLPKSQSYANPKPGTQSLFQVSHMGAGSQGFGPSSNVFSGHKQETGWEVGPLGYELAPIWDSSACGEDFIPLGYLNGPINGFLQKLYIYPSICLFNYH